MRDTSHLTPLFGPGGLARGANGGPVYAIQGLLLGLGYTCQPSGTYDEVTAGAVRAMQIDLCLEADEATGELDARTTGLMKAKFGIDLASFMKPDDGVASRLFPERMLETSHGWCVEHLQRVLKDLGLREAEPDGTYDAATAQQVRELQASVGHSTVSGNFDPETKRLLLEKHGIDLGQVSRPAEAPLATVCVPVMTRGGGTKLIQV